MNRTLSIYLDVVRFTAALVVFLGHAARGPAGGGTEGFLWQFSILDIDAVTIFFVLSGFVITHVVRTSERSPRHFFTNRAARIYSVAVPAIILTAVLDYVGSVISPSYPWYSNLHPQLLPTWLPFALAFINDIWGTYVPIGTNTPYWSLCFEVWYYVLFGCALFAPWRWAIFSCIMIAVFLGPGIIILFPVWLAGGATYRIIERISRTRERVGWCLLLGSTMLLVAFFHLLISGKDIGLVFYKFVSGKNITFEQANYIFFGQGDWPRRYIVCVLFILNLVGFRLVGDRFATFLHWFENPIRWVAGMTFSLYLYHFPLLTFLAVVLPGTPSGILRRVGMICIPLLVIAGIAQITERKKSAWRWGIDAVISTGLRISTAGTSGDRDQSTPHVQKGPFIATATDPEMTIPGALRNTGHTTTKREPEQLPAPAPIFP
jgi:peptidoglycan/LPS O-acetylase OafA/YrhL